MGCLRIRFCLAVWAMLRAHFDIYSRAHAQLKRPGLHRSVCVETTDLAGECGGDLRAYCGRAFLPGELPAGFSIADLR